MAKKIEKYIKGDGTQKSRFTWIAGFPKANTPIELKLAMAAERGQQLREESWVDEPENKATFGRYTLSREDAFIQSCEEAGLPDSTWYLISLANHWCNDLHAWAEAIIKGEWYKFFDDSASPNEAERKELEVMRPKQPIADVKVPDAKAVKAMFDATDRTDLIKKLRDRRNEIEAKYSTAEGATEAERQEAKSLTEELAELTSKSSTGVDGPGNEKERDSEDPERFDGMS